MPSSNATATRSLNVTIGKVVNPLGTVTTITESPEESILAANEFSEEYSSGAYIHENCDEAMFRPYVAVISGNIDDGASEIQDAPEPIGRELIVPVIDSKQLKPKEIKSKAIERGKEVIVEQLMSVQPAQPAIENEKKKEMKKSQESKWGAAEEIIAAPSVASVSKSKDESDKESARDSTEMNKKQKKGEKKEIAEQTNEKLAKVIASVETIKISVENVDVTKTPKQKPVKAKEVRVEETRIETAKEPSPAPESKKKSKISAKFSEPIVAAEEPKPRKLSKDNGKKVVELSSKLTKDDAEKMLSEIISLELSPEICVAPIDSAQENDSKESKNVPMESKSAEVVVKPMKEILPKEEPKPFDEILPAPPIPSSSTAADELIAEEPKKKNRKQRRAEKLAAEAAASPASSSLSASASASEETSSSNEAKQSEDDIVQFTLNLKDKRESKSSIDFTIIENYVDSGDTTSDDSRKNSKAKPDDGAAPTKSTKKKKSQSKEAVEKESIAALSSLEATPESDFTFAENIEPTTELDSLSFKSTTEDPTSFINFESPAQDTSESVSLVERTEYDKLSDDIEVCGDGQFADCKTSDIDTSPKTSDSSETEDSSTTKKSNKNKSKESKNGKKKCDDEELQPLIDSATSQSDTNAELTRSDPLPDDVRHESVKKEQSPQPQPQQPQQQEKQQSQQQSNVKKKFRKKRR